MGRRVTPLAWIGLFILALPWLCSLTAVLWGLAYWWTRPRHPTPVTPPVEPVPEPTKPAPNVCRDCNRVQGPALLACWLCGGTRLKPVDPSENADTTPYLWI